MRPLPLDPIPFVRPAVPRAAPPVPHAPAPPLDASENFEPYPVDALPEPVREFVAVGSEAIGCDPVMIVQPVMAMIAATIGNTRRVALKEGWTEPAVLWPIVVADSGTLKSPAFDLALRPIRKKQSERLRAHKQIAEAYEAELANYESEKARWKRRGFGDPPAKPERPTAVRYLVGDTTCEALAVRLNENPRGLLVARDELSGWLRGFDQYKAGGKGGDAANWLEMFRAEPVLVDRKADGVIYVPRAFVCVTGAIQPEVLRKALGSEHVENGLAARLLLAMPPAKPRTWTDAAIPQSLEATIARLVDRLLELHPNIAEDSDPYPVNVPLDAQARAVFIRFVNRHGAEQAALTGGLRAAWSKLEAYVARLALVIHFIRWAADMPTLGDSEAVDVESIEAAIQLVDWYRLEARRVYGLFLESNDQRDDRSLVEWIAARGGSVTPRELCQRSRAYGSVGAARTELQRLVEAGFGVLEVTPAGPAGGRPSEQFLLSTKPLSTKPPLARPWSGVS